VPTDAALPDGGGADGDSTRRIPAGLGPAEIRRLCGQLGVNPSKRLGQNFVHDANTVRRIVREARVGAGDRVLEVGPGLGSLTLPLLDAAAGVVAVEVDRRLAAALPRTVAERAGPAAAARLQVLTADALTLRGSDVPGSPPDALVANLPYNVSVPVLLHLWQELPSLRSGLVMVQAEVADRLTAPPGSRTYGAPTVKLGWSARAEPAGRVPRGVFWPVPNVDSALVRLRRVEPPAGPVSRAELVAVVDAAFAQRRKSLRAALAGWAGSASAAEEALRSAGVPPSARGEQLDVADFARVAAQRPRR
jgi:16S rRNA (adenine1518-N6/adenine1519-N6)-dimethyltransferase